MVEKYNEYFGYYNEYLKKQYFDLETVYECLGLKMNCTDRDVKIKTNQKIFDIIEIEKEGKRIDSFHELLFVLDRLYELREDSEENLSIKEEFLNLSNNLFEMGMFKKEHNEEKLAIRLFQLASRMFDTRACLELALYHQNQGDYKNAMYYYRESMHILEEEGRYTIGFQTNYLKFLMTLDFQKQEEALNLLREWDHIENREIYMSKEFLKVASQIYSFFRKYDLAIEKILIYFNVFKLKEKDIKEYADLCNRLSIIYNKNKNEQKSREYLKESAELNFPDAMYKLGMLYYYRDREKGINYLLKGFLDNHLSEHPKTLYFLGCYYLDKENYIDAEIYMRKLYRMNFKEAILPMAIISRKMAEIYCLEAIEEDVSNARKIYEQIKK